MMIAEEKYACPDPSGVGNAFGNLIRQQAWDPNLMTLVEVTPFNDSRSTFNVYLYTGEQFDPDLKMYFLRARYLEPDRGRFWTMDTFEGVPGEPLSLHKYLYVGASPVIFSDKSGLLSLQETLTTAAIIGFVNGTLAKFSGRSFIRGFAVGFAGGLISASGAGAVVAGSQAIGGMLVGLAAGGLSSLTNELINLIDHDVSTSFNAMNIVVGATSGGTVGYFGGRISSAQLESASEFAHSLIIGTSIQIAIDIGQNFKSIADELAEWTASSSP